MQAANTRKSIRLKNFDYSTSAAYFVTICVDAEDPCLSSIDGIQVRLSPLGRICTDTWNSLAKRYEYVVQDIHVMMPNHMHGILCIMPSAGKRKPLSQLVGAFKTMSTKRINEIQGTPGLKFWERGYYERVLRNDKELEMCREYILNNPFKWSLNKRVQDYPWKQDTEKVQS